MPSVTSDLVLISHPLCPYVQRAAIVLHEKSIPFERINVDLSRKPEWFREISPLGRVPLLKTQGAVLFESQVIAEYLDEITPGSLHPEDPLEKARHRSWIEAGSNALAAIGALYNAKTPEQFGAADAALRDRLSRVAAVIEGPFFAGDRFHMIDGVWATVFRYFEVFENVAGLESFTGYGPLGVWRAAVMQRPSVQAAAPRDYHTRLARFLKARDSEISRTIQRSETPA